MQLQHRLPAANAGRPAGRAVRLSTPRATSAVAASRCSGRRLQLAVFAHGPAAGHGHGHGGPATATKEKQEKEKGFINEMRMVAMKLHTREQAPKEGGTDAPKPAQVWTPTREGYLRFLAESKIVYDALETAVKDNDHPEYAPFRNTGLERSGALAADMAWFESTYGLKAPQPQPDSPGSQYAAKMIALAKSDPPAFICHFYNFYFAHTAGGRMIGNKVASMILDNTTLKFYQWEGDVAVSLDAVRAKINALAEGWSREQKDHCLAETQDSFKMSGTILRLITESA